MDWTLTRKMGLLARLWRQWQGSWNAMLAKQPQYACALNLQHHQMAAAQASYQRMFDYAPYGIYQTSPDGHLQRANHAFAQMLGYSSPEELLARDGSLLETLYVDPQRWLSLLTELQTSPQVDGFESQVYRKDGSIIWITENVRAVYDEQQNLCFYESFLRDITARKQAESLRISDERYALAARAGKMGVWDFNPITGDLYLSPALKAMLGYTDDEVSNDLESFARLSPPEDGEDMVQMLRDIAQSNERHCEREHRMQHKDGTIHWFIARSLVIRDKAGIVRRIVGASTNINKRKYAEVEREHALALTRAVVESATGGVIVTTLDSNVITFNQRFVRLWQSSDAWQKNEPIGLDEHLSTVTHQVKNARAFAARVRELLEHPDQEACDIIALKDGRTFERYSTPYRVGEMIVGRLWSYRDVTERERMEEEVRTLNATLEQHVQERTEQLVRINRQLEHSMQELHQAYAHLAQSEAHKQALLDAIPDSMLLLRHDGMVLDGKAGTVAAFCFPLEQARNSYLREHFPPDLSELYESYIQQAITTKAIQIFEYQFPVSDQLLDYEARLVLCGEQEVLAVVRDITERKSAEHQLRRMALHDSLTGLPNRALLHDRLNHALERTRRDPDYHFAVLLIDADDFKRINDGLGHLAGDQMLTSLAYRLNTCVRSVDTVARLGGDEFAILLDDIVNVETALEVVQRLQQIVAHPFRLGGQEVIASVSTGLVLNERHHTQASDMLRDADIALYRAKAMGRGQYALFDADMHTHTAARLTLETELRRAIENEELLVYYQPIVNLQTLQVDGFEALVRWQHPQFGILMPGAFLPLAVEVGVDVHLDRWMLKQACHQLHDWQKLSLVAPDPSISVNLSSRHLIQPDLVSSLEHLLLETGIDPQRLMLEITENSLITYDEQAIETLKRLHALGIVIGLDDFGTGYSSLSYLHRFPVDILKIDRSFVGNMERNQQSAEIVRTVVQLAHNLQMRVIAEGAETESHLSLLSALNCTYVQGFVFSAPLNEVAAQQLITDPEQHEALLKISKPGLQSKARSH